MQALSKKHSYGEIGIANFALGQLKIDPISSFRR